MRPSSSAVLILGLLAGNAHADEALTPLEPDAQSAVLNGGTLALKAVLPVPMKIDHHAFIARVDDQKLGSGFLNTTHPFSVRLTPGPHSVQLIYGYNQTPALSTFLLDAEAGKSYRVHLDWIDFDVREWYIEDAVTGAPVGRLDPGAAYDATVARARTNYPAPMPGAAMLAWDPLSSAYGSGKKPRLTLTMLDGTKEYRPGSIMYGVPIAPGKHKATFAYYVQGSPLVAELEFVAEPDRTYAARARLDAVTAHIRIEDAATGEAIAEADSSKPRIYTPTGSPLVVLVPADAKMCPLGTKCEPEAAAPPKDQ